MPELQQILWSKGTLLTPQHLQLHDHFLESLLSFRFDTLCFRPWGFSTLEIDRAALTSGEFAIRSGAGIFPDGLLFDIPSSDQAPGPLAVTFQADETEVDIHLAIPAIRVGAQNITRNGDNPDSRFTAEVISARDETTGTSERSLLVARRNFRFLTRDQTRTGIPTLRVARIQKRQGNILELDPEFVPPLLDISASEYLLSVLRGIVEILTARSSELAALRRQKNQMLADFPASDIAGFWLLYTVNSWLPEVRHIFETRRGHPELLFRILSSLAGAPTTFSTKIQPRDLPRYDHNEVAASFKTLDIQIRTLLETVVHRNTVSLPFRLTQPSMYAVAIENDSYLQGSKMYLAVAADIPEADLIRKAPHAIKLCSASNLDHLVKHALPGLPLRFVAEAPRSIPVKLNYQYFSIDQSGALWDAVMRSRSLGAHVPSDFTAPKLELLIVLPEPQ